MKTLFLLLMFSFSVGCAKDTVTVEDSEAVITARITQENASRVYHIRFTGDTYCLCFPQPKSTPCYYFVISNEGSITQAMGTGGKPVRCVIADR